MLDQFGTNIIITSVSKLMDSELKESPVTGRWPTQTSFRWKYPSKRHMCPK